jgi:hypothetical protein
MGRGPGVVLYELHANVSWGGLLLIVGIVYCWYFSPARESKVRRAG